MIEPLGFPTDPPFPVDASLHFLTSGDYLFRQSIDGRVRSKFVTARDVAAAFSQKEEDTGWLPPGVVRCGHNLRGPWFVYSAPPQKVEIVMRDEQLTVPVPRTILVGVGPVYHLFASRSKHFEPAELAYRAPFPNVYPDGRICWGSNSPPEADPSQARRVWELFFAAPFNRDLSAHKSETHPDDVGLLLIELAERAAKTYPVADLVGDRRSVEGSILKAIG